MKKEFFGNMPDGRAIELYSFETECATLKIMTRGATVVSFAPFGREIVGGFDRIEDYVADTWHQGGLIGRVCGRIAEGAFEMDGVTYELTKNEADRCLHGGEDGFDHRLFTVTEVCENSITLEYRSEDGEEGFPSALLVRIVYKIEGSTLLLDYFAYPEGKTPISLTNHSYFNLGGFGGTVLDHVLTVDADSYNELDPDVLPTGRRLWVTGTPHDFRAEHTLGERLSETLHHYDTSFNLNRGKFCELFGYSLPFAARIRGKSLALSVYTDQPCIQLFVAPFENEPPAFRGGVPKITHGAFCLEAQTAPGGVRRGEVFYEKGEVYRQTTVYRVEQL